ncbi:golgin subfamily B member 1-like [Microtus pennsylvanicus]|uniref:golgin subfamily B member 1-like n=1 Tax=Microtus pennsylvanicus TaxID=10058 RepID=UPI003F6C385B
MTYLDLKIVFLHFIIPTDPSDGAYNKAPEQNRLWLHHAQGWLHPESSDSPSSRRDDMEMLNRLSGLANVVLHELSGYNADQNMTAPLEAVSNFVQIDCCLSPVHYFYCFLSKSQKSHQESSVELNNSTQDDVLEPLAEAEKLVVELKDIISQKDAQLQQKDEALQEERKAADNKIKKIKLHAKAKLTSLNKHLEEMKAQGGAASPTSMEPQPAEPLSKHDKNSTEEEMKVEEIKCDLQEKEKFISHLQAQLHQAQSEQAVKLDKSSAEMEEFVLMKQQLQEKEEVISTLRTQLSQTQAEQAAQVG